MAGLLDTIKAKTGIGGAKKYETSPAIPPFSGMSLKEKLQAIVLEKRTTDRNQRIRRHTTWYLMNLYYQGYQNVDLSQNNSSFDVFEKEDFYVENQFRKSVDTVKQILNKLEGEYLIRPASDNPKDLAKARVADPILEMQRDTVGYDRIVDQKNLNKCLFGNSFQFTDYITSPKYGSIVTPKYSYQEMPDPTFDPMTTEDPMAQPESMMTKTVNGYQTRNKGRQIATVCSPLEINCPVDVRPFTEIPYLQWISRQETEILNYLYPGLNVESGMSSVEVDLAQQ